MAQVELKIGGNAYTVACRDGEEAHLTSIASLVDSKATQARQSVGGVSEVRQLLFASLLLADELEEARGKGGAASASNTDMAADDARNAQMLEDIAARLESLAARLEQRG
jgi:cell division protein ZapA